MVLVLSILGGVFSLGGNVLIARKRRSGWLVWIAGNITWILVNFLSEMNVPMVAMYVAYFVINVIGYRQWQREADVIEKMCKKESKYDI